MFSNAEKIAKENPKLIKGEHKFKAGSIYEDHRVIYLKSLRNLKKKDADFDTIDKITERLKMYPIKCFYYNDQLDGILIKP
jgi:hypothetical protein